MINIFDYACPLILWISSESHRLRLQLYICWKPKTNKIKDDTCVNQFPNIIPTQPIGTPRFFFFFFFHTNVTITRSFLRHDLEREHWYLNLSGLIGSIRCYRYLTITIFNGLRPWACSAFRLRCAAPILSKWLQHVFSPGALSKFFAVGFWVCVFRFGS